MPRSGADACSTRLAGGAATNVVLIVVDDLGWADLACYGHRHHKTPQIDRLSRQGTRFTHGYAACAVCSPTRAAVMTGRYTARLGVTDFIPFVSKQRPEFERTGRHPQDYVPGPGGELWCPPNHFWHFPHFRQRTIVPYSVVRAGPWKLIFRYTGIRHELFHLLNDPSEQRDVAAEHPGQLERLQRLLDEWLAATEAKLPRLTRK